MPGMRFAGKEEISVQCAWTSLTWCWRFAVQELVRMQLHEFIHEIVKINIDFLIISGERLFATRAERKSCPDWLVDVQRVSGSRVPRVRVRLQVPSILGLVDLKTERPILDEQAIHGGACRAAIQPNQQRHLAIRIFVKLGVRIDGRSEEPVEEVLVPVIAGRQQPRPMTSGELLRIQQRQLGHQMIIRIGWHRHIHARVRRPHPPWLLVCSCSFRCPRIQQSSLLVMPAIIGRVNCGIAERIGNSLAWIDSNAIG
mmetsp:Transcript_11514/g.33056  ORF Transcript_11514/g.33056 Transcript_11514/m.33056 type:complete len:256 (+) Transcript_11514:1439-2206(+)